MVGPGVISGSYYLEIETMDLADTCTQTLLHLFVKDIYPPQFNTQTIPDTAFCGPFVIKSEITDFSGIFTDSLYYKVNQGLFNAVAKDSISGGIYHYTIPGQSVWDAIYYYLSATDNQNNRGTDPANAPDSLFSFVILPTTAITEMNVQKEKFNIKIYPNPTRNRVNIQLTGLVNAKRINLKIYDVTGRLVRQWDNRTMRPSDKVTWSGDDDLGWRLPSGVYFIQLVTDEFKKVEKVILLR
jgi:hypothetical protein